MMVKQNVFKHAGLELFTWASVIWWALVALLVVAWAIFADVVVPLWALSRMVG